MSHRMNMRLKLRRARLTRTLDTNADSNVGHTPGRPRRRRGQRARRGTSMESRLVICGGGLILILIVAAIFM